MSEQRYFKIEYDEEWYLFDSTTISEQLVKEQAEYGYGVFANSLSPSEICDRLNTLHQENQELKSKVERMVDVFKFEKKVKYQCSAELKQLRKENEQLKEKVMVLEKLISDVEISEGMSIDNLIDTEMIDDE